MKKRLFFALVPAFVVSVVCSHVSAAKFDLDFATDPAALGVEFFGSSEWRSDGGVNDSGYLSITDNLNSQRGAIVFPDLEKGNALTSFIITADLRVGGGTPLPADGFSFNFVRPDDPVLDDGEDYAASPTNEANLPEEGTTTGLGIGFDEWYSGGEDVIGMSIRIDNELIEQIELPVLNAVKGDADYNQSLQTGPDAVAAEDLTELAWEPFAITLTSDNNLSISWKGEEVFKGKIDYAPSPGLLVFAGRTGGSNAYHHIDNITIETNIGGGGTKGDFDGDGDLDATDINQLCGAVRAGNNPSAFDVTGDGKVDKADHSEWVGNLKKTYIGDANLDKEFNSSDFVAVFTVGKYETGGAALWQEGDWNCDGLFDSGDFVAAFTEGGYEKGPHPAVASVPEPAGAVLMLIGICALIRRHRTESVESCFP